MMNETKSHTYHHGINNGSSNTIKLIYYIYWNTCTVCTCIWYYFCYCIYTAVDQCMCCIGHMVPPIMVAWKDREMIQSDLIDTVTVNGLYYTWIQWNNTPQNKGHLIIYQGHFSCLILIIDVTMLNKGHL